VYIVDDDAGTVELVGTAVLNTENNWEAVVIDQTGTADTKYRLDWRTHGDGTIIKAGSVNLYHEGNGWTPSITGSGVLNMAVTYDTTYQVSRAALVPRETVLTASAASDALVSDLTLTIGGQQVVIPDAEYMGDAADRTLNSANQWKAEWSNLDRTDEKGTLYYYYVVESSVSGYTASYEFTYQGGRADQGIDLVKITNTKEETDTTSITVKKNWSGDLSSSAVYTAEFTLLDSRGEKVTGNGIENPVTLSANGSYTWSDLPPDTYSVQETAAKCNDDSLTSYTTTCQVNGQTEVAGSQGSISEGTIVFTNTVRRQGIVLPSTGSGYSIVFYGLGCVFLLISAAWMFLTFKKRNIPVVVGKGGTGSSKT
jgi:LPXTG-motif cell wall-anchored protein